jgi:hypothetical protein
MATNVRAPRGWVGSRLKVASRSGLLRPISAGVLFFLTALIWASRGADDEPLLPSIQWSGLAHPLLISAVGGLVTFAVVRHIETPRRHGTHMYWVQAVLAVVSLVAAAVCLSWGTAGMARQPAAGQWIGVAAGLVLAFSSAHLCWRLHRRRSRDAL